MATWELSILHSIKKTVLKGIQWQRELGQAPRSQVAYATHIPVLVALARLKDISRVLELGSGMYSTALFLDRTAFPQLVSIDSYENDAAWFEAVSQSQQDPRLSLNFVDCPLSNIPEVSDLQKYDLILVDDSTSSIIRQETINQLTLRRGEITGVVAIHDFEQVPYRIASKDFRYRMRFRAMNPEVGVVWEINWQDSNLLKKAGRIIKKHYNEISPDDIAGWVSAMDELR